mmetsp:Transcript_25798/g.39636  ORF Transcript_25798/g.39636 Transcript_25798/m.39636 type:complete len:462 (+) Transcript_25798:2288-3673(+)
MQDGISLEDLLKVGVVSGESVVRAGRLSKQQTHGISLVTERRLDTNENISKLFSVNNEVGSVRVQVSRGRSPVLLKVGGVRSELIVFVSAHAVGNIKFGGGNLSLGVIEDGLHDGFLVHGGITDIISVGLELLQNSLDGVKHIKVGGSSNITLVRGEGEDGDSNLLIGDRLSTKVRPLHGTVSEEVDTVSKGDTATGGTLTSGVNDGLNGTIDFRKRNLQCNLDRMESEFGSLPFFERLENKRDCAHVRTVQSLENLSGLLVILGGGTSNKGETCKVDNGVNNGTSSGIVEVFLNRSGEVKSSRVDGDNACSTALKFRDERNVVGIIFGVDVRLLKNQTDSGGSLGVDASQGAEFLIIPFEVFSVVFENNLRSNWMPDGLVGKKDGLFSNNLLLSFHGFLHGSNVVLSDHHEKRLKVLRGTAKPILERHHKCTGISSLIGRKEFKYLRKSTKELEHTFFER